MPQGIASFNLEFDPTYCVEYVDSTGALQSWGTLTVYASDQSTVIADALDPYQGRYYFPADLVPVAGQVWFRWTAGDGQTVTRGYDAVQVEGAPEVSRFGEVMRQLTIPVDKYILTFVSPLGEPMVGFFPPEAGPPVPQSAQARFFFSDGSDRSFVCGGNPSYSSQVIGNRLVFEPEVNDYWLNYNGKAHFNEIVLLEDTFKSNLFSNVADLSITAIEGNEFPCPLLRQLFFDSEWAPNGLDLEATTGQGEWQRYLEGPTATIPVQKPLLNAPLVEVRAQILFDTAIRFTGLAGIPLPPGSVEYLFAVDQYPTPALNQVGALSTDVAYGTLADPANDTLTDLGTSGVHACDSLFGPTPGHSFMHYRRAGINPDTGTTYEWTTVEIDGDTTRLGNRDFYAYSVSVGPCRNDPAKRVLQEAKQGMRQGTSVFLDALYSKKPFDVLSVRQADWEGDLALQTKLVDAQDEGYLFEMVYAFIKRDISNGITSFAELDEKYHISCLDEVARCRGHSLRNRLAKEYPAIF